MNFLLVYFSGTGNTELLAHELAGRLTNAGHTVTTRSVEDPSWPDEPIPEHTVVGFGFPVYKFTYPDLFAAGFSALHRVRHPVPYFLYASYARFEADALYDFSRKLGTKQFRYLCDEIFKAPSCGISARKPEADFEWQSVMFFEDGIHEKLDAFAESILRQAKRYTADGTTGRLPRRKLPAPFAAFRLYMVRHIERTKYPLLQIDGAVCTRCGLCAARCPDHNLVLTAEGIEIQETEGCLHCLRCMNRCPANAISFGKLSKGPNQFTTRIRDRLFRLAISGNRNPHWANFPAIRRAWRRATLHYWATHWLRPER